VPGAPRGAARKLGIINNSMRTQQWQNYGYWLNKQLYDAQTNTSDVEEIGDQNRRRNELPGIHRLNRPCLCWKTDCCKATWRNLWERRGACTHCNQLNENPTLPTPPLPTPLSSIIIFHISSWYQFIFVYFSFENLILHILWNKREDCELFTVHNLNKEIQS